jgi:hypothetical protein
MPSLNIYSFVSKELRRGKVIVWSRALAPLFPELTFKQIEDEVLSAFYEHGGGAGRETDKEVGRSATTNQAATPPTLPAVGAREIEPEEVQPDPPQIGMWFSPEEDSSSHPIFP